MKMNMLPRLTLGCKFGSRDSCGRGFHEIKLMLGILLNRPLATTQMDIFRLFGVTAWDYTVSCAAFACCWLEDRCYNKHLA